MKQRYFGSDGAEKTQDQLSPMDLLQAGLPIDLLQQMDPRLTAQTKSNIQEKQAWAKLTGKGVPRKPKPAAPAARPRVPGVLGPVGGELPPSPDAGNDKGSDVNDIEIRADEIENDEKPDWSESKMPPPSKKRGMK